MKKANDDEVLQFKITLRGIKPPIWRRIQVPSSYTFWDLHVAILNAMGWLGSHLHQFLVADPRTGKEMRFGIPLDDEWDDEYTPLPGWKHGIKKYFPSEKTTALYEYDFGDSWRHKVTLEKILPAEENKNYPVCIKGARSCPPEDCGGVWGYMEILEALKDFDNEECESLLEWLGLPFDPEAFDPASVHFDDPQQRWEYSIGRL